MQQKQHCTEEMIRILRQAEPMQRSTRFVVSIMFPKRHSIAGNANTATWTWPMPNGSKSLKKNAELKKMLAESLLKNRVLEEVNAKKW